MDIRSDVDWHFLSLFQSLEHRAQKIRFISITPILIKQLAAAEKRRGDNVKLKGTLNSMERWVAIGRTVVDVWTCRYGRKRLCPCLRQRFGAKPSVDGSKNAKGSLRMKTSLVPMIVQPSKGITAKLKMGRAQG